jgi:hypothetical protein
MTALLGESWAQLNHSSTWMPPIGDDIRAYSTDMEFDLDIEDNIRSMPSR